MNGDDNSGSGWSRKLSDPIEYHNKAYEKIDDYKREMHVKRIKGVGKLQWKKVKEQTKVLSALKAIQPLTKKPALEEDAGSEGTEAESEDFDTGIDSIMLMPARQISSYEEPEIHQARALTEMAEMLVDRQRATLHRIEAEVNSGGGGSSPTAPSRHDGGASSVCFSARGRMGTAASQRRRPLQRSATMAPIQERVEADINEKIDAVCTRKRDRLAQESADRVLAARSRRNQQVRARRELLREEDRKANRKLEELEEKHVTAAKRREERNVGGRALNQSTSLPALGTPDSDADTSDFMRLMVASHAKYRQTMREWEQRESERESVTEASWTKAMRRVNRRASMQRLRAEDFLSPPQQSDEQSARQKPSVLLSPVVSLPSLCVQSKPTLSAVSMEMTTAVHLPSLA